MLDLGEYLIAVAQLAAIAGALAFGAIRLRRALLPTFSGAPARLAEAVLGLSAFLLICEVLGLVGLFEQLPLLIASLRVWPGGGTAGGAPASRGWRGRGSPPDRTRGQNPPSLGGRPLQLTIAIAATAVVFTHWAMPTLEALGEGIYGFDSQWYHLPFAARFAETGSIWDFHYTTPVLLSWFYPANSELLHAAGMVITGRDVLSPLLNLGWLALGPACFLVPRAALGCGWSRRCLGRSSFSMPGCLPTRRGTRGTM